MSPVLPPAAFWTPTRAERAFDPPQVFMATGVGGLMTEGLLAHYAGVPDRRRGRHAALQGAAVCALAVGIGCVWASHAVRPRARVRSHCRLQNNRGIEYLRKSGIKWMNGSAKRQCDQTLYTHARATLAAALGLNATEAATRLHGAGGGDESVHRGPLY